MQICSQVTNIQNECVPFSHQLNLKFSCSFDLCRAFHNFPVESRWQNASIWNEGRWVEPTHARKAVGLALLSLNPSKRAGVLTPFLFPIEKRTWMPKPVLVHVYIHHLFWFLGQLIRMWAVQGRGTQICAHWMNFMSRAGKVSLAEWRRAIRLN